MKAMESLILLAFLLFDIRTKSSESKGNQKGNQNLKIRRKGEPAQVLLKINRPQIGLFFCPKIIL